MPQRQIAKQGQTTQRSDGHFTEACVFARLLQWGKEWSKLCQRKIKHPTPGEPGTMAALVGNKPHDVNKQKMNGACHEAGIWEMSGFQAFYGSSKEARIIHVHCQMSFSQHSWFKMAQWERVGQASSCVKPRAAGSAEPRNRKWTGVNQTLNLSPSQPLPGWYLLKIKQGYKIIREWMRFKL